MKHRRRKRHHAYIGLLAALLLGGGVVLYFYLIDERIPFISGPESVAPEILMGVGPDGVRGDKVLNRLKNRTSLPEEFKDYTVNDILKLQSDVLFQEGRRIRDRWYPSARLYAQKMEAQGVRITGHLVRAKKAGAESSNGYVDSLRNFTLWLADKPNAEKRQMMIAEVTPRWQYVFPDWQFSEFKRLADQNARVRVSGWLLWDQEFGANVERSRGTQWEVHPVTMFEVYEDGEWRELRAAPIAQQIAAP